MNPTQLKSLADAILAHLRGEPVQYRRRYGPESDGWSDATCPNFEPLATEWRPKPKEPRKVYMVESDVVRPFLTTSRTEASTVAHLACPKRQVIEFLEVP